VQRIRVVKGFETGNHLATSLKALTNRFSASPRGLLEREEEGGRGRFIFFGLDLDQEREKTISI
jgi:hypothetical protein